MSNRAQLELTGMISRNVDNMPSVPQRLVDGYINATEICKGAGKSFADYSRMKSTNEFLNELSSDMGIHMSALIQQVRGGNPVLQGTWVHPQVAINLGQWASPKFAVLVSKWVIEWMSGSFTNPADTLPYHLRRYMINRSQIPSTHFSVFNEVIFGLIAPLEDRGYQLPDSIVPDISQGKIFAKWVRDNKGLEPNDFPTYTHIYPDGRSIPNVKLYPNFLLGDFRDHFNFVWIPERASKYFNERDTKAIPFLAEVLASLPAPETENAFIQKNKSQTGLS